MCRIASALVLILLTATSSWAQHYEVTGTVVDTSEVALPGATVMILDQDSTLLDFGITRHDGRFQLGRVPTGDMVLEVTFVGFESYAREVSIVDQSIDVGTLVLGESTVELEELMVTAEHVPLLVRRDTLDYNVAAFRVPPNANVEDLLRRLPGIEVDPDGTIRAQGEVVRRLLVDGREFFGFDPTVATRSLPADAVERVQVYDTRSDTAELTGIDDGERERTIDLQLREGSRRGAFGNMSGAVGDPERYELRGSVHRFAPTFQLSVLGNLNNINEQGFRHDEFAAFLGGAQNIWNSRLVPSSSNAAAGFATTRSGGVNLSTDLGSNTTLQTSYLGYFLDRVEDVLMTQRELSGFAPALTGQTSDTRAQTGSHRIQLKAEHEFGDGHDLEFEAFANIGNTDSESTRLRQTTRPDDGTESFNDRRYDWSSNYVYSDAQLTYRRRLSPGRTIVAYARTTTNDIRMDTDLESTTRLLREGNLLSQEEVRTIQDQQRYLFSHTQRLTYTEPLGTRQLFTFDVEHRAEAEDRDYATSDIAGGEPILIPSESMVFDRTNRYLIGGASFRRSVDGYSVGARAAVQQATLAGQIEGHGSDHDRRFVRFLPSAWVHFPFAQSHHLRIGYSTVTREPTMHNLQPFIQGADPINQYQGNPDLRPQYQHRFSTQYQYFDTFTNSNLWAFLNFSYFQDAIVPTRTVRDDLTQLSSVANTDGTWDLNASLSRGRPFRPLGVVVRLSVDPSISRAIEFLNDERNVSRIVRTGVSLSIENAKQDVITTRLRGSYTFNDIRYELSPQLDRSYLNRSFMGTVHYRFLDNWHFITELDYQLYAPEVSGGNRALPLLRVQLSWDVPRSNAEVRLEGHDLLDQSLGVSFTNNAAYVREQRTATLGRLIMLKVVYRLAGPGGASGPPG